MKTTEFTDTEIIANSEIISQLPREMNASAWTPLRIKRLHMTNYGVYKNTTIDFTHNGIVQPMTVLVGPNGTGKTTILSAIQLLFFNFAEYDKSRVRAMMQRHLNNVTTMTPKELLDSNLEVRGVFESDGHEYEISVTLDGVSGGHPDFIKERLKHYCFTTRYDQELHLFQVRKNHWNMFQRIFSAVTGYPVEEDIVLFNTTTTNSEDAKMMGEYVTGFRVIKPSGTIIHKQCSAGERKIAKCFSTLLNKDVVPNIILIDNVTDHVENDRHLPMIANIEQCFSNSQIIATCHSVPIQRNLPRRERLVDMRLLSANSVVRKEPWRLRYYDEVQDAIDKAGTISEDLRRTKLQENGKELLRNILNGQLEDFALTISEYCREVCFHAMVQARDSSIKPKIESR